MLILAALFTLQQTLQSMRAIHVDDDETRVPVKARRLLNAAKAELRALAIASLHDQPADAGAAAAHLRDALMLPDVPETPYGSLETEVTTHGDVMALVATFAIPCGSDSALFLFRNDRGVWKLVLDRERNGYDEVSGAAGYFAFDVSPPDADGFVMVISSDVTTSCNSNWQLLRWRVDRVGVDRATLVTQQHDSVYLGDDDYLSLAATPAGFVIEYMTRSADEGRLVRKRLLHYHIDAAGHLTRIDPTARSAEDAVDEWLQANHVDALGEFDTPLRLPDGMWRLTFSSDGGDHRTFVVSERNGSFRVLSAK